MAEIRVNDRCIDEDAVLREMQYHPAENAGAARGGRMAGDPGAASGPRRGHRHRHGCRNDAAGAVSPGSTATACTHLPHLAGPTVRHSVFFLPKTCNRGTGRNSRLPGRNRNRKKDMPGIALTAARIEALRPRKAVAGNRASGPIPGCTMQDSCCYAPSRSAEGPRRNRPLPGFPRRRAGCGIRSG